IADLPLRANEPLSQRRLRKQEGARHLARLQSGDLTERQRDLRVRGERRMAAREDEAEAVVGDRAQVVLLRGAQLFEPGEELGLPRERLLAADPVDRPVARARDDPSARIAGHACARPSLDSCCVGVLQRILGELEVTEDAYENREGTTPFLPKDRFDG